MFCKHMFKTYILRVERTKKNKYTKYTYYFIAVQNHKKLGPVLRLEDDISVKNEKTLPG